MSSPIRAEERIMRARFARVMVVACVATLAGAAWAQDGSGDTANGKRVYLADGCITCHGRSGQGGALNYQAPALAQIEMPVEAFVTFLREAPKDMPAYSA